MAPNDEFCKETNNIGNSPVLIQVLTQVLQGNQEVQRKQEETIQGNQEIQRKQEETSKQLGDALIQNGGILKKHDESLEKQKTENAYVREQLGQLKTNGEINYNTMKVYVEQRIHETQEENAKVVKNLQDQIDKLQASNINNNNAAIIAPHNNNEETPRRTAGGRGRDHKERSTLGMRLEAIREIEKIKTRTLVGTHIAMMEIRKTEQFSTVQLATLKIWWKDRDSIKAHLLNHPDDANKRKITRNLD